jgi:hypothetical protein
MARRRPFNAAVPPRNSLPGLEWDGADPARALQMAAADCTTRVADVLSKLGYGFDMIGTGDAVPPHRPNQAARSPSRPRRKRQRSLNMRLN